MLRRDFILPEFSLPCLFFAKLILPFLPASLRGGKRVVDHGLVVDGQQLLVGGHGERVEARACTPTRMMPFICVFLSFAVR